MLGFGLGELSIILGILVVLFGASRLPGLGHGIGRGIANFKRAIASADSPEDRPKAIDEEGNRE